MLTKHLGHPCFANVPLPMIPAAAGLISIIHLDHLCPTYVNRRSRGSQYLVLFNNWDTCCGPVQVPTYYFSDQQKDVRERLPLSWRRPTTLLLSHVHDDSSGLSLLMRCSHLSRYFPARAPNVASKVVRTARVGHVPSLVEASGIPGG